MALKVIQKIQEVCNCMLGDIERSCDDDKALRKGIELPWIQMINARHYDVLCEIFSIKKSLSI